jgi:hypothetical protein
MERLATWVVGYFPESIQSYLPDGEPAGADEEMEAGI